MIQIGPIASFTVIFLSLWSAKYIFLTFTIRHLKRLEGEFWDIKSPIVTRKNGVSKCHTRQRFQNVIVVTYFWKVTSQVFEIGKTFFGYEIRTVHDQTVMLTTTYYLQYIIGFHCNLTLMFLCYFWRRKLKLRMLHLVWFP